MTRVSGDSALQSAVLESLGSARNYRAWLVDLTAPWLGDDALEVGSGLGDYAVEWAQRGVPLTVSEADPDRLAHLRHRFDGHPTIKVRELAVPVTETANYSAVVAVNVLEHIADDVAALRAFAGLVRAGGRVVVFVPAFRALYSRFDREIGHERRYRKATLDHALRAAGLHVERLHYVNMVGSAAWLVMMRLLRGRPREGLALRAYDALVPLLRRLEARWRPPFGQSLLAVARRPPA
jgi:SAM-dependent methyltransferase